MNNFKDMEVLRENYCLMTATSNNKTYFIEIPDFVHPVDILSPFGGKMCSKFSDQLLSYLLNETGDSDVKIYYTYIVPKLKIVDSDYNSQKKLIFKYKNV